MLEHYIRPAYQRILVDPLAQSLARYTRVSANQLTLFSGVLAPFILLALWFHHPAVALGFLLLSGYLDTLDGTLARFRSETSEQGSVLDIVCDRVVELSVFLGLYLYAPDTRALACLAMLGSSYLCITSFLVVGIFTQNESQKSFHYSPGLMERGEAFIFFVLMIAAPFLFQPLAWAYTLLVLWTAGYRVYEFMVAN
ncbi:MAG: hypothetical protein COV52_06865 [Gammaproteobacteria bacterium CG11_big_fil_rev_8_21_14_0_20_46_22]|nr:MAG: hypothetical protein COW05_02335 [Gammaproteobacteria bacterium CG12_big_fil_rev_8_21_14_0_65_46_12]PIR10761.1 MAG: hypothetical protein COV52_06865 [Gammaproteobacteria bacterium CG11_big_fil_rev_8_21_14_0_20_46_22]